MERGCYFLLALPPPDDPREPDDEPRDEEPELREELPPREELPRDTLPDLPDDEEPVRDPPDLTEEPLERPDEGLPTEEPEDGREVGPVYDRALPLPPSPYVAGRLMLGDEGYPLTVRVVPTREPVPATDGSL